MKKPKRVFTPLCPGCEELQFWVYLKRFVARAKKQGIIRWIPTKWLKDPVPLENRDNHIDDCRWQGRSFETTLTVLRRLRENRSH